MGSWNQTCGITQLPIHAGEKVVSFLLVSRDKSEPANICYSAEVWQPIYIPFYGEYDDYGYQDMDEGQEWKFTFLDKHLNDLLIEHPGEGGGEYTITKPLLKENHPFLNWEMIKDHMHRGTLKLTNRYGENGSIGLMMIKLDVYNSLIGYDIERYKKVFKAFGEFTSKKKNSLSPIMDIMEFQKEYPNDGDYSNRLPYSVFGVTMDGGFVQDYDSNDTKSFELMDAVAESLCLHTVLYELRKMWQPQCGQGSQSSINFKHQLFLTAYVNEFNKMAELENESARDSNDWYEEYKKNHPGSTIERMELTDICKLEWIEENV